MAKQDQTLYKQNTMQQKHNKQKNFKCSLCQQLDTTIDHITPACRILENNKLKRHDSTFLTTL